MVFLPANIDLLLLPTDYRPFDYAQAFAEHIYNLHVEIGRKIILSNGTYNLLLMYRRHREFNDEDYVMVHICPECYSKHTVKSYMLEPLSHTLFFVCLNPMFF